MRRILEVIAALVAAILLSGCVAAAAPILVPDAPPVALERRSIPGDLSVYTDWSRLTPYTPAKADYTLFQPFGGETLSARDDYGALLPYIGEEIALDGYILDALPLFGLATLDGRLVTDPVYADIYTQGNFLILARSHAEGWRGADDSRSPADAFLYTIAAPDGRWVRNAGSCEELFPLDQDRLLIAGNDGSVKVLTSGGTWAAEYTREALSPYLGEGYAWNWDSGPVPCFIGGGMVEIWQYDETSPTYSRRLCCLDTNSGTILSALPDGWTAEDDYHVEESPELPGYSYLEPVDDLVTGERYYCGWRENGQEAQDLLDGNGKCVLENYFTPSSVQWEPIVAGGMIGAVADGAFTYRDMETESVMFRYPLRTNSD